MAPRFGIFQRLLLAFLLASLLAVLAIWVINRQQLTRSAGDNVEEQLRLIAQRLTEQVDGWTSSNIAVLQLSARMPAPRSLDPAANVPVLQDIVAVEPWAYLAHLIGADGRDLARSDGHEPGSFGDRRYVQEVFEGTDLSHEVVIGKTSHEPAWAVAVAVRDDEGRAIGALSVAANLDSIAKVIEESRFGRTGYAFLMQSDGKLIASPREDLGDSLKDYHQHPAYLAYLSKAVNPVRYSDHGREVIAYIQPTAIGWINVVQEDASESREPVLEADRNAFVVLGLTVALALGISYALARGLAKPIERLTEVADQVSRGQLEHSLEQVSARGDEIGALSRAIERLAKSTRIALDRLRAR